MNNFIGTRGASLLAGSALMLFASLSRAQYMWIDEKGMKQFSDRPPPASVPASKILKTPGAEKPPLPVTAIEGGAAGPAASAAASAPPAAKAPPTLAERNADFRKRQKEQAEQAQKAAEDAQHQKDKEANCQAARDAKAQLDSGARIGTVDKNGERAFVSDEERAQRSAKANKVLEGCR